MHFQRNSFRKKDVVEAVGCLSYTPEIKTRLRDALLDYGRAHKADLRANSSTLSLSLPAKMQEKWAAKTEKRLSCTVETLRPLISAMPEEQEMKLFVAAASIKEDRKEKRATNLHQVVMGCGTILTMVVTLALSDPLNAMMNATISGLAVFLVALGHWRKKVSDFKKAKAFEKSVAGLLERMHVDNSNSNFFAKADEFREFVRGKLATPEKFGLKEPGEIPAVYTVEE